MLLLINLNKHEINFSLNYRGFKDKNKIIIKIDDNINMPELNTILFEILIILMLYIFIFIYSAISSDTITTCLSLSIFLILLLPFYILLKKLRLLLFVNNLEDKVFFKILFFYSTLINIFIGFFLIIQLVYLFITQ